ncbi:response regulator [Serpentinicella sp. ANB-PHB4]|uniref:response regulator n=1 Tax=Serpentinicella sp. ANB-PHB4 TaxID=3074076 RepID=UPI002F3FE76B
MARILIVDDSLAMRKNLKNIIERINHQVVGEAKSGEQAITLYKELRPDLVTMDITMPGMGGIEAVKRIISDNPDAKIMMVSAMSQKTFVLQAVQAGALNYIIKPIDVNTIDQVINKTLQMTSRISKGEVDRKSFKQPTNKILDNLFNWEYDKIEHMYKVSIYSNINHTSFVELNSKIATIMFEASLKIQFYFYDDANTIDINILTQLQDLIVNLKNVGATVEINTNNSEIKAFFLELTV